MSLILTISLKPFPCQQKDTASPGHDTIVNASAWHNSSLSAVPVIIEQTKTKALNSIHKGTLMPPKNAPPIRKAPFITISLFLALATIGISLNEPGRVLEQAWQVCLSCIGIG